VGRPTQWWLALLTVAILTAAVIVLSPVADWLGRRPGARAALLGSIAASSAAGLLLAALVPGIPLSVPEAALVALATLAVSAYVVLRIAAPTPLLPGPPPHEVVAAASFLLLPLAGVVLAKLVTNAYADRYALPATIGLAVLPFALHRLEGRRPLVGAGAVAALAVLFVVVFVAREQNAAALSAQAERTLRFLEANAGTPAPILIDNPHQFLELSYASRPRLARRLFYVADPAWGSIQRGLPELGRIASLRVYERRDVAELPGFLLALAPREAVWSDPRYWSALRDLRDAGRTITAEAVLGDRVLYAVTAPARDGTVEQPASGRASRR
jgi:hypothetical protein